ncbi:hypothetical protein FWF48_01270 [Candidatus Saccharibacteria bacterium]|nr:hypothetical protein [Candidatus Saccharibacteria bacterium]
MSEQHSELEQTPEVYETEPTFDEIVRVTLEYKNDYGIPQEEIDAIVEGSDTIDELLQQMIQLSLEYGEFFLDYLESRGILKQIEGEPE